ncbi:ROK family protein [Thermus sp.]|uniref:ROK family protein n=1 Tax=Thermus sp. TaxID=275 RepID=UPI0039A57336
MTTGTHANFVVIKVGTGIGAGIVCQGEITGGLTAPPGMWAISVWTRRPRCHCGNVGRGGDGGGPGHCQDGPQQRSGGTAP